MTEVIKVENYKVLGRKPKLNERVEWKQEIWRVVGISDEGYILVQQNVEREVIKKAMLKYAELALF